jgi:hypothetical protein
MIEGEVFEWLKMIRLVEANNAENPVPLRMPGK